MVGFRWRTTELGFKRRLRLDVLRPYVLSRRNADAHRGVIGPS